MIKQPNWLKILINLSAWLLNSFYLL